MLPTPKLLHYNILNDHTPADIDFCEQCETVEQKRWMIKASPNQMVEFLFREKGRFVNSLFRFKSRLFGRLVSSQRVYFFLIHENKL